MIHDHVPRTLIELTRLGISMVANANLAADVPDESLAQRILAEADPLFVEELKLALTSHRMVSWIQSERRLLKRKQSEQGQQTKPIGPRVGNPFAKSYSVGQIQFDNSSQPGRSEDTRGKDKPSRDGA
jgi:hypothetical protein